MRDPLIAIRNGEKLTLRDEIGLILKLSFPAILAQISSIIMQYIDASMVGHLGANASASIGLVSSSTWLFAGIMTAASMGFSVKVAHKIGAKDDISARNIVKWGLAVTVIFGIVLSFICSIISIFLPGWMGGDISIQKDASRYFLVYALSMPFRELLMVSQGMIQSSGNIRIPSILNVIMCGLDVIFNMIFIPRFGVLGAALGTALAIVIISFIMLYILLVKSEKLSIIGRNDGQNAGLQDFIKTEVPDALKIAIPVAIDNIIMGFAYVAFTRIVSPFGTTSIAANSFSITAESLCYMPGFGIGVAATTIVGQCIGAGRRKTAKRLGWMAVLLGMSIMGLSGVLMWIFAPQMIGLLSPDEEIRTLGTIVLRIEAFAEPFYGASIVAAGVFRGAGETLLSSVLNLFSVWFVRIPLAAFLGSFWGLKGAWIAMATELCVRGILFLVRLLLWNEGKKNK
ncbi:MATE family efflux transporter [Butyrivibrio sp. YAB3001]|uniref:MATE family efflux transporter n=1 Tax=Butyrivibrio sp. YAB3001 TaxID=1520812 RepID=UPI0008F67389|nr:MATE family efflux transporter [Butyrivibrio sp. YAB3001]SFC90000.1 putative efflux protein, MATE family [Butyrivibrio sp. YAB3001]